MSKRGILREYNFISVLAYVTVDLIALISSALLAHYTRFGNFQMPMSYRVSVVLGLLFALAIFPQMRLYGSWRGHRLITQIRALAWSWVAVILALVLVGFLLKASSMISRQWLGFWAIFGGVELAAGRALGTMLLRMMRYGGHNIRRLIIVGTGPVAERVIRRIHAHPGSGLTVNRVVALPNGEPLDRVAGVPVEKELSQLLPLIEAGEIDEVWLCMNPGGQEAIQKIQHCLRHTTVTQRLIPDLGTLNLIRHRVVEVLDLPMLNLTDTPMQGTNRALKAIEDRVLAALILITISPVLLLITIAVMATSEGPVFYRQKRVGWDGLGFEMLKFRSMPVNAEAECGAVWNHAGDKRATPLGSFLRSTSLDELPQFFNVLKGDMSIVGPRPERPVFVDEFKDKVPGYMQKHLVKAGITGWAQVNGWRGNTDLRKRVEHDLYYIEHWSLSLDIKIIFLTVLHGFVHKNAY